MCSIDVCWGYPSDSRGAFDLLKESALVQRLIAQTIDGVTFPEVTFHLDLIFRSAG